MARNKQARAGNKVMWDAHNNIEVNFAQDIADHASELLWGQGFQATHENPTANKRLSELVKYNDFDEQFPWIEKLLSLFGNIYTTIEMVDGKPTVMIADPYLNSTGMAGVVSPSTVPTTDGSIYGMGRAYVDDMVAVIWKRITYGTFSFPVKEIWTKTDVKRIFYGEQNKTVRVAEVNKVIPAEMQVKEHWVHNMGFVPVIWHKNMPSYNSLSPRDGYKGNDIQELANHTLSQQWYETATNRTRLFGSMNEEKFAELVKSGQLSKMVVQDLLVNVPQRNSTGEEPNQLVPIQGDPKLAVYQETYNALKDEYFKLAGYSPLGDGATEKTATESLLMKTADYQTTKKKRNIRAKEVRKLIFYMLSMDAKWGFGDIYGDLHEKLSFEINENKVMDSLQEIQNINLMVDNDFMSKVEAIKKIRGVSMEEARAIFDEILAEKARVAELDTTTEEETEEEGE